MNLNYFRYKFPLLAGLHIYLVLLSISANEITFESIKLEIAGNLFELEVADTPERRQRGLMYRQELTDRSGMIFIYAVPGDNRIWMKNTLIPLTVVWLDDKAQVIDIKKLEPCHQLNCPVYSVATPSKYIIEFNTRFKELERGDDIPAVLSF